jgi:ADP-ribose pyrophosphatase YjhB (NUDIX family)
MLHSVKRHITVTTYVLDGQRTLLIFHPRLQKWMAPGGHLEEDELPHEGALREVKEETGLDVELLLNEDLPIISTPHSKSIPRPYLCVLQDTPAMPPQPRHQHLDMIFIGRPHNEDPPHGEHLCRWLTAADVEILEKSGGLFADTLQILRHLFQKTLSSCKVLAEADL